MRSRGSTRPDDKSRPSKAERHTRVIRVLLASPEAAELLGLATIVTAQSDMELVAQTAQAEEASQLLATHRPDIAVVDADLLEPCVVNNLVEHPGRRRPPRLLVLVMHARGNGVQRALQARAQGILLRGMNYYDFLDAIRTVHGGNLYSPGMAAANESEQAGAG